MAKLTAPAPQNRKRRRAFFVKELDEALRMNDVKRGKVAQAAIDVLDWEIVQKLKLKSVIEAINVKKR